MTAPDSRRGLVALAGVALVALIFSFGDRGAHKASNAGAQTRRPGAMSAPAAGGVFSMEAQSRVAATAQPAHHSTSQPPPLPFAFLGRITEGGETRVLLHSHGRVLTVRGTGPLVDGYEVDAILDDLLVIRYVPLGTRQVFELAARLREVVPQASPEESPQD